MGDVMGAPIDLALVAVIFLAAAIALFRNRQKHHRTRARITILEALEEQLTLRRGHDGKLTGECIGHAIEIDVRTEGTRSWLAIDLPLARNLSTLALTARTPNAHPDGEHITTGDEHFDPRFHVRGDRNEALMLLGRETRDALVSLLNARPGIWWDSISIREQRMQASLQLMASDQRLDARCASMIRELVYCASVLDQPRRAAPFTRLVSEASKQQAPGYRSKCLELLAESHADNLGSLRAHPDIGLRFICFERHPEHFKEPAYLREMLLEIAHNHEDARLRARALAHLSELIDEACMVDDEQPLLVRLEALENASKRRTSDEFDALVRKMLFGALPRERTAIVQRLERFGWDGLSSLVIDYAHHEDLGPVDTETLLELSRNLSHTQRREVLESLLQAPSHLVRLHTIRALARKGGSRSLALLRNARRQSQEPDAGKLTDALDDAIDTIEERLAHAEF